MATKNRSDAHSPRNLVTEDYKFVTTFHNEPPIQPIPLVSSAQTMQRFHQVIEAWRARRRQLQLLVSSSDVAERGLYQCHHCGAQFKYMAIMLHKPTGQHIAIGETCLDNRFERASAEFHQLRKSARLDREKQRIRKAVAEFAEANPDLAFMAKEGIEITNSFVRDVSGKLLRYGSISERQIEAVRNSLEKDRQRQAEREAREAIRRIVAPLGRYTIEGEVITLKEWASDYGTTTKMTVVVGDETTGQWTCWGSVPTRLDVEKGDRVRFTATFEPSHKGDDDTFVVFKRPTNAEVVK